MPKQRPRLFPFDIGRLIRLSLAVSLALVSLLVTLQLTWSTVQGLTTDFRSPGLWLLPDGQPESFGSGIFGNRFRPRRIDAGESTSITVLAPPDKPLTLRRNDQTVYLRRDATGRSSTGDLRLRPGLNTIQAASGNSARPIEYESVSLDIAVRAASPEPPRLLARWRVGPERLIVLGLVDPATDYGSSAIQLVAGAAGSPLGQPSFPGYAPDGSFLTEVSIAGLPAGARMALSAQGGTDETTVPEDNTQIFVSAARAITRRVVVNASSDAFTLSVVAEVPLGSRLHRDVADRLVGAGVFLREVFGLCLDHGYRPGSEKYFQCYDYDGSATADVPVTIDEAGGRAVVSFDVTQPLGPDSVTLAYRPSTSLATTFLTLPSDTLRLERTETASVTVIAPGADTSGLVTTWAAAPGRDPWVQRQAAFLIVGGAEASNDRGPRAVAAAEDPRDLRPGAGRIIDRIFELQSRVPPRIRRLIDTLVTSIPFFGFIWILNQNRNGRPAHLATLKAVTVTFLLVHITLAALALFEAFWTRSMLEFVQDVAPYDEVRRVINVLQSLTYIYPFLAIGIVLLVNPVYTAVRRTELATSPFPRRRLLRGIGWLLFWALVVFFPLAAVYGGVLAEEARRANFSGNPELDEGARLVASLMTPAMLLGVSLCGLWFVLFWLLRGVLRIRIRVRDAVVATWAVLLLPLAAPIVEAFNGVARQLIATQLRLYPLLLPERASPYISTAIVAVLGAILLLQTIKLSIRLSQHGPAWRWFLSHRRQVLLGLIVVSLPVITGPYEADVANTVLQVFYLLDRLLPYALLIGAAAFVRVLNRTDSFALSPGEIYIGALVFAWYVSGRSATLLFIPIPFILAWYLFRHWLVLTQPVALAPSTALVEEFIEERRTRARIENLEKGLDRALGQGELKLSEYQTRLQEGQAAVASLAGTPDRADLHIFASGPEGGPWQNAKTAVRYGFFLSLPLQLVTLVRMLGQDSADFPFLQFTYALVVSTTTWVLTAALFGYFYHVIRGQNGFEKALWYSLAVVAPVIPLDVMFGRTLADRAQLLDIVQVFAFILVLALVAFDLRTLQKHRYGWRDLFTVYGLASAAYGSTIAVAIVSTVGGRELLPRIWDFVQWLAGTGAAGQ